MPLLSTDPDPYKSLAYLRPALYRQVRRANYDFTAETPAVHVVPQSTLKDLLNGEQ